nr:hypothetical protein [Clostridia bacterium]
MTTKKLRLKIFKRDMDALVKEFNEAVSREEWNDAIDVLLRMRDAVLMKGWFPKIQRIYFKEYNRCLNKAKHLGFVVNDEKLLPHYMSTTRKDVKLRASEIALELLLMTNDLKRGEGLSPAVVGKYLALTKEVKEYLDSPEGEYARGLRVTKKGRVGKILGRSVKAYYEDLLDECRELGIISDAC